MALQSAATSPLSEVAQDLPYSRASQMAAADMQCMQVPSI